MAKAATASKPLHVVNTGSTRFGIGPGPKYKMVNGREVLRTDRTPGVAFFDSVHDDNVDVQAKAAGIPVVRFGRRHTLEGDHAAALRALPKTLTDRLGLEIREG